MPARLRAAPKRSRPPARRQQSAPWRRADALGGTGFRGSGRPSLAASDGEGQSTALDGSALQAGNIPRKSSCDRAAPSCVRTTDFALPPGLAIPFIVEPVERVPGVIFPGPKGAVVLEGGELQPREDGIVDTVEIEIHRGPLRGRIAGNS